MSFSYFSKIIYPPIVILIGLISNIFVIAVYSRRKFHKLPTKNIWRYISLAEIVSVLQILKHFIHNTFDFNLESVSSFVCKILSYFSHFGVIPAWFLVFLSFDRLASIIYTRLSKFLRKHQLLILLCIILGKNRFIFKT